MDHLTSIGTSYDSTGVFSGIGTSIYDQRSPLWKESDNFDKLLNQGQIKDDFDDIYYLLT